MQFYIRLRLRGGAPQIREDARAAVTYGPVPEGYHVRQVVLPDPEKNIYLVMPDRCTSHELLRRIAVAGAIPPYTFQ
eukprot:10728006-Prorocentrum_lima.AAC.1